MQRRLLAASVLVATGLLALIVAIAWTVTRDRPTASCLPDEEALWDCAPRGWLQPDGDFHTEWGQVLRPGQSWPSCGSSNGSASSESNWTTVASWLVPACAPGAAEPVAEPACPQPDGSLSVGGLLYPPGAFWREPSSSSVLACACPRPPCLNKCCALGEIITDANGTCEPTTSPAGAADRLGHFKLYPRDMCAFGKFPLNASAPADAHNLLESGELELTVTGLSLPPAAFCVETLDAQPERPSVFLCFLDDEPPKSRVLYSAGMLLSEPFLLATLFVYAVVRELRNLHGLVLMSHVAALFVAYLVLAVVQLYLVTPGQPGCLPAAFIIYFSFLASFFWLNVMCLDIWWTFSGYRPMRGSVKEREHKKFIIYSLYCWGGPLIMLTICMIMDLHPGIPDSFKKPGFGKMKCWFETHTANLLYFNGPIAVLIVCNIVLFICTAFKIQKLKQETKILKKQDSRRHNEEEENNTQRFVLYLKLFLVMGVNWSMEVISFAIGGKDWWWYLTDIANTLQGVLIFVIFVWKDRIWRLLRERFCPQPAASVVSSGNTTSTHTANTRISSSRNSIKRAESEQHQMKRLVPPPSARADDSDIA